jgi:hypothetical protein
MTALCQEISLGGAQQQLQNDREHVRSLQTVKPHVAEFLVRNPSNPSEATTLAASPKRPYARRANPLLASLFVSL